MRYAGRTIYMLINESEIINVFEEEDEAKAVAENINEDNVNDEIKEAGYEPEELDEDERAQFAFSSGFNNGYAYCHKVTIPVEVKDLYEGAVEEGCEVAEIFTEETVFCTEEGDEFTYGDVIKAIDSAVINGELEPYNI